VFILNPEVATELSVTEIRVAATFVALKSASRGSMMFTFSELSAEIVRVEGCADTEARQAVETASRALSEKKLFSVESSEDDSNPYLLLLDSQVLKKI